MPLLDHVQTSIASRRLIGPRARIVVAVSGGLDSMVLLHLLDRLARQQRWQLVVAHFDHRLRGAASRADARFVQRAAAAAHWPVCVESGDTRAAAAAQGLSLEMAARALRHDALARIARRQRSGRIALAHHADDQVELFFLRLLRGAGSGGLAGMNWSNPSPADARRLLIRPLLDCSRAELEAYARQHRLRWRHDASNDELAFDRNRIRHELLPRLKRDYQTSITPVILRLMEVLREESDCLEDAAGAWLHEPAGVSFPNLPLALQRRAVRRQLHGLNIEADFDLIERLRLRPQRRIAVAPGRTVSREPDGRLRVEVAPAAPSRASRDFPIERNRGRLEFNGCRIAWQCEPRASGFRPARAAFSGVERFDADRVGRRIRLRHWRPGDRFQPIGMKQSVKLQNLFTNAKVPKAERHRLVVACTADGELWWVEGLRIGERFKIRPATKRCLHWQWSRSQ